MTTAKTMASPGTDSFGRLGTGRSRRQSSDGDSTRPPRTRLPELPSGLAAFLDAALPILEADRRLVGVAAGGSAADGTLDEYSDLDLVLVAAEGCYRNLMAERLELAGGLGPLLSAFTGEHVGEPRLLICLYGPPLVHIDLKFVDLGDFRDNRVEDPVVLFERDGQLSVAIAARPGAYPRVDAQWIEDRFWTWVHYLAARLGRGEIFEVVEMLSFLRLTVLGPMSKTLDGRRPRGMRQVETEQPHRLADFRATLPRNAEKAEVARAASAAIVFYRALRSEWEPAPRRSAAETAAVASFEQIIAD